MGVLFMPIFRKIDKMKESKEIRTEYQAENHPLSLIFANL